MTNYLSAIDLQSCGVTTEGARLFIEVLKLNPSLMVLDVRANALIGNFVDYNVWEMY